MSIPFAWYLDREEIQRRFNRDVADQLGEAIDAARIALTAAFCSRFAFDLDVDDQPVIAANAEQVIVRAFTPLESLRDTLERKARRA